MTNMHFDKPYFKSKRD